MERAASLKARQIKAARALLNWSQDDLAAACGLSIATIRKFELDHISPRDNTVRVIRAAFENAGLEFVDPDGVKQRPEDITVYQGSDGARDFFDDVYQTLKKRGGDVVQIWPSVTPFLKAIGDHRESHIARMTEIKDRISMRCILTESATQLSAAPYCEYRLISKHYIDSVPFYIYGDKYASIIIEADPSPKIMVIQSAALADAFRHQFHSMWDKATPLDVMKEKVVPLRKKTG